MRGGRGHRHHRDRRGSNSTTLATATASDGQRLGRHGDLGDGLPPQCSDFTVTIPANATSGTATLSFDPTEDIDS